MKFYTFSLFVVVLLFSCVDNTDSKLLGLPVSPELLADDTDPVKDSLKRIYFEELYYADESVNIDSIRQDNWRKYYTKHQKAKSSQERSTETFAEGYLTATWNERGPNNEAGDMREVDFYPETEEIYGISSVGHLFKGSLEGEEWTVLRDDIRFSTDVLELVPEGSGKRIFAAYGEGIDNKTIRYSDDDGETWTKGTGFSFYDHWGRGRRLYTLSDDKTLYYLVHTWSANPWGEVIHLYKSTDKGLSFEKIWETNTGYGTEDVDLWKPYDSDKLFLVDNNAMTYYEITHDFDSGEAIFTEPLSYSNQNILSGGIHLSGRFNETLGDYELFMNQGASQNVYKSSDGANWTFLSSASENVWRKGWLADPNNDNLYAGGFQLNKTQDYTNWSEQYSQWWVYYSQSKDFMHVDIMNLEYFEKTDGTPFILICNHGGLHLTYDSFESTINLGLGDLNVVTLYDQSTSADGFLYCGAQDKGTFVYNGNSKENFDKLSTTNRTTGDGMLGVFFNNEQSVYGMLQNGYLYCMPDKNVPGTNAYGPIPGNHTSGWINPMVSTANLDDNKAYIAGGNLNGGDGCYLIGIDVDLSFGLSWQASQFNYDFRANSKNGSSVIKAIGIAMSDEDRIYVATRDASFFFTDDQGSTWGKTTTNLPSSMIPWEIISSNTDPDKVFISGTGFSNPGVYQSNNGGDTFVPLSNNIPAATFFEIILSDNEDILFAATSEGPFAYVFSEAKWYDLIGASTPYVNYTSVDNIGDNIIRFGTYGRGVWDFAIETIINVNELNNRPKRLTLYPNPANDYFKVEFELGRDLEAYTEIVDLSGRLVSKQAIHKMRSGDNLLIDISKLKSGVYVFRMKVGEEEFAEKFSKI